MDLALLNPCEIDRTVLDAIPLLAWSTHADGHVDFYNQRVATPFIRVTASDAGAFAVSDNGRGEETLKVVAS